MERSTRLASAPVTWGVWERTADRDDLIPGPLLAETVAGLGFTGIELGPPAYLDAETLAANGLDLVGGFAPLHLADEAAFRRDVGDWLDPIADALAATGAKGPVVLADAGRTPGAVLEGDALKRAFELVEEAAERCRARGVDAVFHHHTATYVETPEEVEAFVEGTSIPLCFDTGHAAAGGGDPVEMARRYAGRIGHLHLKDVDPDLLARVRAGELSVDDAWGSGLFCPLGEGMVDLHAVLDLPELRSFDGWIVLEQDRVAVRVADLEEVRRVEEANLRYVQEALAG